MRTARGHRRLRLFGAAGICMAAVGAVALWPAVAEDYSYTQRQTVGGAASAANTDPFDPVPEIGFPCEGWCGERQHYHHHDEGRHDGDIVVDCSHSHREMAYSVQWALDHVRPNGRVLILPPGEGMTCREHLSIERPVTIATFGGGKSAVIQAPDNSSCVDANVPLGDSLVIDGITFIARGHDAPCIKVRAGHVVVRNSDIDSRNTNWAFDVLDSGELTVENTQVETDGAGVRAYRARVHLHDLAIDMSPNRVDAALRLERTDGEVEGGEIIGGRWGALASPGAHGLSISEVKIRNANTGIELVPGGQGLIHADKLTLVSNRNSLVIAPFTETEVSDSSITKSQDSGIVVFPSDTHLTGNKIFGGRVGIRVARIDEFHWEEIPFHRPDDDPPEAGIPEITANTVADVREADVFADEGAHARVMGNTFYAPPGCLCAAGELAHLDNKINDCRATPRGGLFGG